MGETDKALMLLVGFFLCGIIAFSAGYVTKRAGRVCPPFWRMV